MPGVIRYATAATFSIDMLLGRFKERDDGLEFVRATLYRSLGPDLLKVIAEDHKSGPVTVTLRLKEYSMMDFRDNVRFALEAELCPVTRVPWSIMDIPPTEWTFAARPEQAATEWRCFYCGQVNLYKEHLDCRKCGAPRSTR